MSVGFRRVLSAILVLILTLSAMPAFAEKSRPNKAIEELSCDRDYGFSYVKNARSKGASKSIVVDLLKIVGESIGKKVVDGAVDWAMGDFINSIFGIESVNVEEKFNEVNNKLDEIKRLLDEMYQKIVVADFRGTIQSRDQKYNELKPEVVSRMNSLLNAETAQERKKIIRDWADRSMMSASSGITATTQWGNLISTTTGNYTYIQCYDGYARLAFPWEHDGYDFREAAREADLTLYIDACVLTGLYYNMVVAGEIEGKSANSENYNIEAFKRQIQSVIEYFSRPENQVVRNAEKNNCQITGMTDFTVYVNNTGEGYKWRDDEGYHREYSQLMDEFFYVMGARGRRSVPLKSERLKKLMEFYPNTSIGQILIDKIGVKGIKDPDHDVILIDHDYQVIRGTSFNAPLMITVKGIDFNDRSISDVYYAAIGTCNPLSPFDQTMFMRWESNFSRRDRNYYIICTDDKSDGVPNSDDCLDMTGAISKLSKNALTLSTQYGLDVEFDITRATIEGTCEVGREAYIQYHQNDDGSCVADMVRVTMPVTLLEEKTLSGTVTKHAGNMLTVKGQDGEKYVFELSFNVERLDNIPKGTSVTVTYQPGDDGKLYVIGIDNISYETPAFTVPGLTLEKGATQKLGKLAQIPGTWISGDESIIKIVKGQKVKAVSAGKAELLFTVGTVAKGATYKGEAVNTGDILVLPVTVIEKGSQIKSIAIKPKKAVVKVGETIALTASWKPKTASDTTLTWTSSDESIATVDDVGIVTGVGAGKATITVTAPSGVAKGRVVTVK